MQTLIVRVCSVVFVDDALDFLRVEQDSLAQFLGTLAISHSAKVEDLHRKKAVSYLHHSPKMAMPLCLPR